MPSRYFKVAAALESLGADGSEVAARLERRGCYGRRHDSVDCPVTRWVEQQAFVTVAVGDAECCVLGPVGPSGTVPLPLPVQVFLRAFDRGDFAALEGF